MEIGVVVFDRSRRVSCIIHSSAIIHSAAGYAGCLRRRPAPNSEIRICGCAALLGCLRHHRQDTPRRSKSLHAAITITMSTPLSTTSAYRSGPFTTTTTAATTTTSRKRRRSCSPPAPALTPPLSPTILKSDDNDSSRPRKRVYVRVLVDTPATTPPTGTHADKDKHHSPLTLRSPSPPSPPASRSPLHPHSTAIDPNFGDRVMQAYIDNMARHKQQDAAFARIQHSCRVTKYGAELASVYPPGSTPPRAREEYREWMMEERYTCPLSPSPPLNHLQSSYDHDDDRPQTPASDVPDSPPACMAHDQEEEAWEEQHDVWSRCEGRRKLALDIDRELDGGGTADKRGDV
ncbi:hypothetical protein AC578_7310 [Pseudocercospora eumusae]|uniref:Uncharacterized protein n=1 Tax=Pseudocercospora eumusae TaxID=321146 RepID=A0A139HWW8_9PEZI|nr:hypothetical protein AC578_7310 [Pseudocercospora eumusae]